MGYSKNPQTLEAIRPQLSELEEGRGCIWTHDDPEWFAYKIREALYIARLYPQRYPQLALAADKFKIVILNANQVQAVLAKQTTAATVQASPTAAIHTGLEDVGGPRSFMGSQTAATIIQTWINSGAMAQNDRFFFPQANLDQSERLKLWKWTQEMKLMFFVSVEGALTLMRKTVDMEESAYSPEDEG